MGEEAARGGQEELCGDQKVDRVRQQGEVGTWLEGLRGHQRQEARGQGALRPGVGSDLEVTRSRQDAWSFMILCACSQRLYNTKFRIFAHHMQASSCSCEHLKAGRPPYHLALVASV